MLLSDHTNKSMVETSDGWSIYDSLMLLFACGKCAIRCKVGEKYIMQPKHDFFGTLYYYLLTFHYCSQYSYRSSSFVTFLQVNKLFSVLLPTNCSSKYSGNLSLSPLKAR